jgi:hypothetical protein
MGSTPRRQTEILEIYYRKFIKLNVLALPCDCQTLALDSKALSFTNAYKIHVFVLVTYLLDHLVVQGRMQLQQKL